MSSSRARMNDSLQPVGLLGVEPAETLRRPRAAARASAARLGAQPRRHVGDLRLDELSSVDQLLDVASITLIP